MIRGIEKDRNGTWNKEDLQYKNQICYAINKWQTVLWLRCFATSWWHHVVTSSPLMLTILSPVAKPACSPGPPTKKEIQKKKNLEVK